ncbi:MAG: TetR family transcriptional regulator [Propionibacteriaceae bacterium]|nr:TetR family transcriptional regulator [Propionibacteriaceae bacterium]
MAKLTKKGGSKTRRVVLDAALELVAEKGLQALTHRGIESRANVSHGVTTYYFKNREALIEALIEHICDRQIEWIEALYAQLRAVGSERAGDGAASDYTRKALDLILANRSLTLAGFETYLHAARHPHVREIAARARQRHVEIQAELFRFIGARDPEQAALMMLSATEGLIFYQFSVPVENFEDDAVKFLTMLASALRDYGPNPIDSERTAPPAPPEGDD